MPTGIYKHPPQCGFQKGHISWLKGTKGIAKINSSSFQKGHKRGMFGKKHSDKAKKKMSLAKQGKYIGQNHPLWKGGSNKFYADIANRVYKEHNINIVCENCGSIQDICIHHKDKNYKNNFITNLRALCRPCHTTLHRGEK